MIKILQGDCREVLKQLPDNSIQCCVSSPPYYGLRSYGIGTENGEIGLEQSPELYVAEMVAVFREVRRVLAESGCVFLNLGDSYAAGGVGVGSGKQLTNVGAALPPKKAPPGLKPKDLLMIPARVALALQADGWWLRSDIIWAKPNPMPESVNDRPTSAHEHVFLLAKSARYFWDAESVKEPASENTHPGYSSSGKKTLANADEFGVRPSKFDGYRPSHRNIRNVWTIATEPFAQAHFATFPPALAEICIKAGSRPGDTVLDPFAGAGTTLMVASRLGRSSIGVELNPAYAQMARNRVYDDCPMFSGLEMVA